MKKILFTAALAVTGFASQAQSTWTVDKSHGNAGFIISYMTVSEMLGTFKSYDASITTTKDDFTDATIEFNAEVKSIDTDNEGRDKHLQSADFFDAEKYPTLNFKSTSFKKIDDKNYSVTGELTIHGITKTVTLNALYKGSVTNPRSKKETVAFKVTGKAKRSDFKIAPEMTDDLVGDEFQIFAYLAFSKN